MMCAPLHATGTLRASTWQEILPAASWNRRQIEKDQENIQWKVLIRYCAAVELWRCVPVPAALNEADILIWTHRAKVWLAAPKRVQIGLPHVALHAARLDAGKHELVQADDAN